MAPTIKIRKNYRVIFLLGGFVLLLAVAAGILLLRQNSKDSYRNIQITELEGSVSITRPSVGQVQPFPNMNLESGDQLVTGASSYAVLKLDNDKYVLLQENSSMELTAAGTPEDSQTTIILTEGSALANIEHKLSGESNFNITTPSANMSVRGTVFEARYELADGIPTSTLFVYNGQVAMQPEDGSEEVLVPAGAYSAIEEKDGVVSYKVRNDAIREEDLRPLVLDQLNTLQQGGREINLGTEPAGTDKNDTSGRPADDPAYAAVPLPDLTDALSSAGSLPQSAADRGSQTASSRTEEDSAMIPAEDGRKPASQEENRIKDRIITELSKTEHSSDKDFAVQDKTKSADSDTPKTSKDTTAPKDKTTQENDGLNQEESAAVDQNDTGQTTDTDTDPADTQIPEKATDPVIDNGEENRNEGSRPDTTVPDTGGNTGTTPPAPPDSGDSEIAAKTYCVTFYLPEFTSNIKSSCLIRNTKAAQVYHSITVEEDGKIFPPETPGQSILASLLPEGEQTAAITAWYTAAGRPWNFLSDTVTSDTALFPEWLVGAGGTKYYTVIYDYGFDSMYAVNVVKDGSLDYRKPIRDGYRFYTWEKNDGSFWGIKTEVHTSFQYLKAVWIKDLTFYACLYLEANDELVDLIQLSSLEDIMISIPGRKISDGITLQQPSLRHTALYSWKWLRQPDAYHITYIDDGKKE